MRVFKRRTRSGLAPSLLQYADYFRHRPETEDMPGIIAISDHAIVITEDKITEENITAAAAHSESA